MFKVTIGTFDDDAADILVDGKIVGWLDRVYGERFRGASSYARSRHVDHYSIVLTDDPANEQLAKHGREDVKSRAEARAEIQRAFERALLHEITTAAIKKSIGV